MRTVDLIAASNANLLRNKLRTILTVSAIVIGAMTLSLTNAIGNGAKGYITRELNNVAADDSMSITKKPVDTGDLFGGKLHEYEPENTREMGFDYVDLTHLDDIKRITGATEAYPVYQVTPEFVTTGQTKYMVTMSTYTPGLDLALESGSLMDDSDYSVVLLPKVYAEAFYGSAQNATGKSVTFTLKEPTGKVMHKTALIKGVLSDSLFVGTTIMGSGHIMKEFNDFQTQSIVDLQDKAQTVIVRLPDNSEAKVNQIKTELDAAGYRGDTLQNIIGGVNDVIATAQAALNLFGAIALLAATFGIVNTLLMAVYERTKEIGLLKALGLSRKKMFAIFAFEAASIGFWGGLIGAALSILIGQVVNRVVADQLKDTAVEGLQLMSFPLTGILSIVGLIMLISFVAGVIPALRASRLDPIEALKYE